MKSYISTSKCESMRSWTDRVNAQLLLDSERVTKPRVAYYGAVSTIGTASGVPMHSKISLVRFYLT